MAAARNPGNDLVALINDKTAASKFGCAAVRCPIPSRRSLDLLRLRSFVQERLSTNEQPLPNSTMSSGKRSFFAPKKKAMNPFDSDSDHDKPQQWQPERSSSMPSPDEQQRGSTLLGAGGDRAGLFSSSSSAAAAPRSSHHYRNDFRDANSLEGKSVQELEARRRAHATA